MSQIYKHLVFSHSNLVAAGYCFHLLLEQSQQDSPVWCHFVNCVQASCYFPREPSSLWVLPGQFPLLRDGYQTLSNTTSIIHNCQQNQDQPLLYLMSTLLCTSTSFVHSWEATNPTNGTYLLPWSKPLDHSLKDHRTDVYKTQTILSCVVLDCIQCLVILTCEPTNSWPSFARHYFHSPVIMTNHLWYSSP